VHRGHPDRLRTRSHQSDRLLPETFIWHVLFHLTAALALCHHGLELHRKFASEEVDSRETLFKLLNDPPQSLITLASRHPKVAWRTEYMTFSMKPTHEAIVHRDVKPRNGKFSPSDLVQMEVVANLMEVLLTDPPKLSMTSGGPRLTYLLKFPTYFKSTLVILLGDFGLSAPLREARTRGIGTTGYTAPVRELPKPSLLHVN
jgi:serine/threonine protein kinase